MRAASIREWTPTTNPGEAGVELLGRDVRPDELGMTLRNAGTALNVEGRAFVLIRLATTDAAGIEAALRLASPWSTRARISLALDAVTFARVGTRRLDTTNVGLLLDEVDAGTPPAALVNECLEAVRFSREFISEAMCSLRVGCALEATLGLARDLGLATLGALMAGERERRSGARFDYTSEVPSENREFGMTGLRYRLPESDQRRFQFSR